MLFMHILTLYSTVGCHLCELAKEQIEPLLDSFSCHLNEVDIANDEQLLKDYGIRIPVLMVNVTCSELTWPFDSNNVAEFLSRNISNE